jgi:hypothetical protein
MIPVENQAIFDYEPKAFSRKRVLYKDSVLP